MIAPAPHMPTPFLKLHGLGNDFVVFDGRTHPLALTVEQTRALADRRTGIGCDQLIVLERPTGPDADVFMRIRNADGGEVEACGNAARCIADLMLRESGADAVAIATLSGTVRAWRAEKDGITVDMGPARTDWRAIPLAHEIDSLHVPAKAGPLHDAVAVNVGNPHAVFFVEDVLTVDLETHGPRLEHDPLFPERANIEAVQVLSPDRLRVRVWERGVGITRACGTGACAALVAAHRRGLTGRRATIMLDGGALHIEWRDDNHVLLSGPVARSFAGEVDIKEVNTPQADR